MGLFGLGKGIAKVVGGIVTGNGEMIVSGLKKTAKNAVTTTAQIAAKEFWEKYTQMMMMTKTAKVWEQYW